jgi:iron complex outermembrane recepter protein
MLIMSSRVRIAAGAAAAFLILSTQETIAQDADTLEEVIVTAQKRAENLQTTPIAISALSAESLENRGVTDFTGIAKASTSINFTPYPSSSSMLILYMRGQGVSDPNQITADGSVGLYEDGFYISRPQLSTFDLADVERVEVLRGPQGTLYGRNTTGGAVNLISHKPTGELDFKADVSAGNRSYVRTLATIDLPKVAGGLSSKVTLLYRKIDGYVHNTGGEDFGQERQKGGRLALRWDGTESFTADYFYEIGDLDSTPIYYEDPALNGVVPGYSGSGQPNSSTWRPIPLQLSTGRYEAHGLTLSWNLGESTTLKSLTGYRGLHTQFSQNYADAFTDPATAAFTGPVGFTTFDIIQSHQVTEELQLVGQVGKRINYVAGLFYFDEGANHLEDVDIPIPQIFVDQSKYRYVHAEAKSKAAYAQATWTPPVLADKLSLTVGARYTKDNRAASRDFTQSLAGLGVIAQEIGASNNQSFSKFNPAFTANMAWTPDINTYARVATGYKAGGSSEGGAIGTFGQTFGPEEVTTYELGLKSYWLEHRLRLNLAGFHSNFTDMQLAFSTNPNDLSVVLSQNAGSARVDGLEVEALALPVKDLTLSVNYTYLDAKIQRVTALAGTVFDPAVNPASPYHVGDNVAAVFALPYAPKNIFNVDADYTFLHTTAGTAGFVLDYRYQDRQFTTATVGPAVPNAARYYSVPPYGLLDARLSWNFNLPGKNTARISLWGHNITDKHYPQHVIGQGPFITFPGTVPGTTVGPGYTYQSIAWAPPPTYGIDFSYGF